MNAATTSHSYNWCFSPTKKICRVANLNLSLEVQMRWVTKSRQCVGVGHKFSTPKAESAAPKNVTISDYQSMCRCKNCNNRKNWQPENNAWDALRWRLFGVSCIVQAGENLLHIFCFCPAPHNKVVAPPLMVAPCWGGRGPCDFCHVHREQQNEEQCKLVVTYVNMCEWSFSGPSDADSSTNDCPLMGTGQRRLGEGLCWCP